MIKASVEFINSKLAPLGYVDKEYGLVEIITKGAKSFPAEYQSKGNYKQINDFDKFNGISYIRKRGSLTISDEVNTLEACGILSRVSIPLRLVIVVPRKKLDCDNKYSEDVIAQTVMRSILIRGGALKTTLKARQATLEVDSYSTNSIEILSEEYSGYAKSDIDHKFAYVALDITINALVTHNCLTQDCYGAYS